MKVRKYFLPLQTRTYIGQNEKADHYGFFCFPPLFRFLHHSVISRLLQARLKGPRDCGKEYSLMWQWRCLTGIDTWQADIVSFSGTYICSFCLQVPSAQIMLHVYSLFISLMLLLTSWSLFIGDHFHAMPSSAGTQRIVGGPHLVLGMLTSSASVHNGSQAQYLPSHCFVDANKIRHQCFKTSKEGSPFE